MRLNMMHSITKRAGTIVLTALCALPIAAMSPAARAEGPATRPTRPPGSEHPNRPFRKDFPSRPPITTEQWTDVLTFMREHSARRTEDLEKLLTTSEEKRASFMKQLISAQYEYVMSLKNEDSELHDLQIRKIETQDAIYGMLRDAKNGMNADQKKDFRELVVKLVDVNLNERQRRIERARESLARAQTTLQEDNKHKNALVEDRMEQLLREGPRPLKMDTRPEGPNDAGATNSKAGSETFGDVMPQGAPRRDGNGKKD